MSLFDRHLNPLTPAFLVVLVLAGIAVPAGPALAQDNKVMLFLAPGANVLRITNQGRGTGVCRPATVSPDCPSTLKWTWVNSAGMGNVNRKIVIELINGTFGAESCLTMGGMASRSFQLTQAINNVTADVSANCPPKSAWIYQIRCELISNGNPCPDVNEIDPGAIIG